MKNLFLLLCTISLLLVSCKTEPVPVNPEMSVAFTTTDTTLQKLYDRAEKLASENIIDYGGRKVLKEGAKYVSVWLETQPMGGYMYAKRNIQVATNNIEIFMDYQREDGRLPGVIYNREGVVTPNYVQFQGLYFAMPAFEMYYLLGKDTAYLQRVYKALEGFDSYLWKTRDSDGDGCLEVWCKYDNGEDHSVRFKDFPNGWAFDFPPSKEAAAKLTAEELKLYCKQSSFNMDMEMTVPMESMDVMSYSYSCRKVLSLISAELENGKTDYWTNKANEVSNKIKSYLWDGEKKACFDRDLNNEIMPILLHNNLRCMHLGSFDQQMADDFIQYHLVNPKEFWTPMPLPSIAANDPNFENVPGNNWSGQPQGLTYQRSIRALENYGHFAELTVLGKRFLEVLSDSMKFTQQFDPYTAIINNSKDGYGPSILTSLEFIGRFYGVHVTQDKIYWSAINSADDFTYTQNWNGDSYTLSASGDDVTCRLNDKELFTFTKGARIITNIEGKVLKVVGLESTPQSVTFNGEIENTISVEPNVVYTLTKANEWVEESRVAFFVPPAFD